MRVILAYILLLDRSCTYAVSGAAAATAAAVAAVAATISTFFCSLLMVPLIALFFWRRLLRSGFSVLT